MSACNCPTCGQPLQPDLVAIDHDAGIIVANGRFAHLTRQEFTVFMTLYAAKGALRSRERLLHAVSSTIDEAPEIKIVDVFVCKVRAKIKGLGLSIATVWGEGYRMNFSKDFNPKKDHAHE